MPIRQAVSSDKGRGESMSIVSILVILVIFVIATSLAVSGFRRIHLPRKPGLEGIEDPEAAEAYDRISRWPQFRLLRRMIARKLAKYQPKGILADIGCGPGRLTMLIAQRHPGLHIVGVDTADEMIRTAASNATSLGLSNRVEFRLGDVAYLPMADSTVDFAVSTLSLHHWSDPSRGFGEIHRILKPGGQLLLFDLRRDPRRFFYWLLCFAQSVVVPTGLRRIKEPLGSLLSSYTQAELQDLFVQLPFKEWKIESGAGWVFAWAVKSAPEAD
jgi:ubiquinone/menaquinone biosynthesis C-methylase UbiE